MKVPTLCYPEIVWRPIDEFHYRAFCGEHLVAEINFSKSTGLWYTTLAFHSTTQESFVKKLRATDSLELTKNRVEKALLHYISGFTLHITLGPVCTDHYMGSLNEHITKDHKPLA